MSFFEKRFKCLGYSREGGSANSSCCLVDNKTGGCHHPVDNCYHMFDGTAESIFSFRMCIAWLQDFLSFDDFYGNVSKVGWESSLTVLHGFPAPST
jgi:hypothetical protein